MNWTSKYETTRYTHFFQNIKFIARDLNSYFFLVCMQNRHVRINTWFAVAIPLQTGIVTLTQKY